MSIAAETLHVDTMNLSLFLASILFISIPSPLAARSLEWHTLTKHNFSSQIQLHPSILLIVTVPWCGESLSLMRDLSHAITQEHSGIEDLKLMRLYRNKEKMLADTLGARDGISIIYYHNSVAYNYRGRLRAVNIVKSIASMVSLEPAELPLKSLDTREELTDFLESTDKAVLLLEFCGWTSRLLNKDTTATAVEPKTSYSSVLEKKGAQKVAVSGHKDTLMCDVHSGFYGFPSFGELISLNESVSSHKLEDSIIGDGLSCNSDEFERFDSFLAKFINSATEMFLPLEKQRFGFVSKRALITSLGSNDSRSWLVMLHFSGCPDCSKTFKEGDDLDKFLQMDISPVVELKDDGHHAEALTGGNPSVMLFVDRSSDLSTVKKASKDALITFRQVALSYLVPYLTGDNSDALSLVASPAVETPKITYKHPKLELSPTSQKIKATQKMSIMIVDGEKHISIDKLASDLHGNTLHQILNQIIKPNKGSKLSVVAREAGFQLLSDDLDIKVEESVQTDEETSSYQPLHETDLEKSTAMANKDVFQSFPDAVSPGIQDKSSEPVTSQSSRDYEIIDPSVKPGPLSENHHSAIVTEVADVGKKISRMTTSAETSHLGNFNGKFYFSDGGYRLLRSLTGGSKMPSLVIIDPNLPAHYVMEEDASFGYSHLVDFVNRFTNKSLSPYQRSESSIAEPTEITPPKHVNLDFHDIDSIPKVSAHVLSNILMNINGHHSSCSDGDWKEDVLVLFTNNWCAFCQRIELAVREVYRALRGYEKVMKEEPKNAESESKDDWHDMTLKSPGVYSIDCTMNDCSSILESTGQIEAYPSLLLFPGGRKDVVTYEGNMEVSEIIRFLADRGSHSSHLDGEKGILWTKPDSEDSNREAYEGSASFDPQLGPVMNVEPFEVRLISNSPKQTVKWDWIQPQTPDGPLQASHKVIVGSILIATEKLLEAYPFDQSKILIVKVDDNVGYQGLILNKHINWNSFQEITEGSELLKLAPLSLGGPVIGRENPLVALARKHMKADSPQVISGVYFLDQSATAVEIGDIKSGNRSNVSDYWFFLGYSSWGWEQLHYEIADGSWKVSNDILAQFEWP
uniref:Thioredoxin domain-containing protein n=1 Tax=Kalanchoe fedtschenkoi TaxID=63787 RepID=A0A7N1A3C0_KALFE